MDDVIVFARSSTNIYIERILRYSSYFYDTKQLFILSNTLSCFHFRFLYYKGADNYELDEKELFINRNENVRTYNRELYPSVNVKFCKIISLFLNNKELIEELSGDRIYCFSYDESISNMIEHATVLHGITDRVVITTSDYVKRLFAVYNALE